MENLVESKRSCWAAVSLLGCIVMAGATAGPAAAALLVHEPFAYPDGWLNGKGGALGTANAWTAWETHNGDWRVHQEGDRANIVIDPGQTNTFDGTVANLPTSGGYVGLPGPDDTGADPTVDHEIGRNLDASIALDPSVTATFRSGTTTWFSYLAVQAWDRNEELPNLTIGTDPSPNGSRAASLSNSGSGIGTGGGPPRYERGTIYPMFFEGGTVHNLNGTWSGDWRDDAFGPGSDGEMTWVASDADGFGAANIVVDKIQWDADSNGEDIISVARFLETDTISEAAFDALIAASPKLSSANWALPANKPDLDQSQFDLINIAGLKFFVDEIRVATTFHEVVSGLEPPPPGTLLVVR